MDIPGSAYEAGQAQWKYWQSLNKLENAANRHPMNVKLGEWQTPRWRTGYPQPAPEMPMDQATKDFYELLGEPETMAESNARFDLEEAAAKRARAPIRRAGAIAQRAVTSVGRTMRSFAPVVRSGLTSAISLGSKMLPALRAAATNPWVLGALAVVAAVVGAIYLIIQVTKQPELSTEASEDVKIEDEVEEPIEELPSEELLEPGLSISQIRKYGSYLVNTGPVYIHPQLWNLFSSLSFH